MKLPVPPALPVYGCSASRAIEHVRHGPGLQIHECGGIANLQWQVRDRTSTHQSGKFGIGGINLLYAASLHRDGLSSLGKLKMYIHRYRLAHRNHEARHLEVCEASG